MNKKKPGSWNTLSGRLGRILMTTFLPVNLLAVIACGVILFQSSDQIQDSYQRELNAAMSRMTGSLGKLEERFSDFLSAYLTELTLAESSDPMTNIEMQEELNDAWEGSGLPGFVCMYDKEEGRPYVRYTSDYSAPVIEELKKELREAYISGEQERNEKWEMISFSGIRFLHRQYEYTNYFIGFFLDMEKEMEELGSSDLWEQNRVYLQSDGITYDFRGKRIHVLGAEEWDRVFRRYAPGRNLLWEQEGEIDLRIGIKMDNLGFRGGIPMLYRALMVVALCSVFLAFVMWCGLKRRVLKSLSLVYQGMQELEQERFDYRIRNWDKGETDEFVFLYNSFNHMAEEIALSKDKDIKMYQVQLDNLRLQVNPHMLLNSFNMIYSLAQSKNYQCIQEYSLLLVEYFRYALKETDRFVPLEKEMQFVENYIGIQKIRFPGAFTSVHNIQPECMEAMVPPLLIENFVENSMKYALISGQTIEVLINIRREEEHLLISVCDTGRGIKPEILECLQKGQVYRDKMGKEHIGVWNCRRRMEVFYGQKANMSIISEPGQGTQVWLDIPFIPADCEENGTEKKQRK